MRRAHLYIIRFDRDRGNPRLRMVLSGSRSASVQEIDAVLDALEKEHGPMEYQYCGDVDAEDAGVLIGPERLDGLTTACALRFAADEYRATMTSEEAASIESAADKIASAFYDGLADAASGPYAEGGPGEGQLRR